MTNGTGGGKHGSNHTKATEPKPSETKKTLAAAGSTRVAKNPAQTKRT